MAALAGMAWLIAWTPVAWSQYVGDPMMNPAPNAPAMTGPQNYSAPVWQGPPGPPVVHGGPFYPGPPEPAFESIPANSDPTFMLSPQSAPPELPPPLEMEESPTYTFFDYGYWFPTDGWSNSFEVGINGSAGNAETFSLRTGARIQRSLDAAKYTLDMKYAKTHAGSLTGGFGSSQETQHNALLNSNVESELGESAWTTFFKTSLEYDEFKAFNVRTAMNAGLGYHLVKTDDAKVIIRFGSGVSREYGGPDDDYVPEAIYGLEFDRQISKRQKLYSTIEYFPDWSNYNDFRLVTNAGWEFLLDEDANLSLKLGAVDRYDSTPHGLKPNDLDYSLVLLWKQ
jgi:hypothetical protein